MHIKSILKKVDAFFPGSTLKANPRSKPTYFRAESVLRQTQSPTPIPVRRRWFEYLQESHSGSKIVLDLNVDFLGHNPNYFNPAC